MENMRKSIHKYNTLKQAIFFIIIRDLLLEIL